MKRRMKAEQTVHFTRWAGTMIMMAAAHFIPELATQKSLTPNQIIWNIYLAASSTRLAITRRWITAKQNTILTGRRAVY